MNIKEFCKNNTIIRLAGKLLIGIAALYAVSIILLFLFQDNLIFFPQRLSQSAFAAITGENVENIELKVDDSTTVRGWLCKNDTQQKQKLIIYFGGNGDEVSYLVPDSINIKNWSLSLTNYRGYGMSDGHPGEKELFNDALKIYDYYLKRADIDLDNIVSVGKDMLLIEPVNLILKQRFDSSIYAPHIKAPLLALIGLCDTTITPEHSRELVKMWGGKIEVQELAGFGHNDLLGSSEVWKFVNDFLK